MATVTKYRIIDNGCGEYEVEQYGDVVGWFSLNKAYFGPPPFPSLNKAKDYAYMLKKADALQAELALTKGKIMWEG